MPSQRFYRDQESAFYAADGLHSRPDVWRNGHQYHHPNAGYGYFAMRPEYVGRFSASNGGFRRFSDQYPQRAYNIAPPQQTHHKSLPYYHGGYLQYPYPHQMNVEQRRKLSRKKHSSRQAQKRQRSAAQFYPGVYPNASKHYHNQYQTAFPSIPTSLIQNQAISSPKYLAYQQSAGIDDSSYHQDLTNFSHNVAASPTTVYYKNETEMPNTFSSRFTRDNQPYYQSDEKTRGESRKYHDYGGRYLSSSIDEVEEEIERNVQDISSDLENYKNEIILRPPGSRAGLAVSRPISQLENIVGRSASRNDVERKGPRYNNTIQKTGDRSKPPTSPSWTTQLASILRSKQDNKSLTYNPNIKHSKNPLQHTQVIHKFLPDATFGIHRQIVETDDHAFNDFECNCNGCVDGNAPLPEDNRSNLGHSYYNLLDDGNRHLEHDPNNNRIVSEENLIKSDKNRASNASVAPQFDAKNIPKLRYSTLLSQYKPLTKFLPILVEK